MEDFVRDYLHNGAEFTGVLTDRPLGGAVVQRVRHLGLQSIGRGFKYYSGQGCVTTLGKLFTPVSLCHQVVITLVPPKGRWCSAAWKATAGLAESNGSLPPGGWLIPRLHDTAGCQNGCQTGCTTGLTIGCIRDTAACQTGCQTGLTTGWLFVYTIQPVVKKYFTR